MPKTREHVQLVSIDLDRFACACGKARFKRYNELLDMFSVHELDENEFLADLNAFDSKRPAP